MSARRQKMFACMLPSGGGVLPPQGQTINIYTSGTSSTDTSSTTVSPYNQYFRYSVMHVFITDNELNSGISGAKTITGLQVEAASSTSSDPLYDWRIYAAHTDEVFLSTLMETDISQSSGFNYSDRIIVFDSASTHFASSGWNNINFETNFIYNGVDNMVLTFEKRYGNYSLSSSRFKPLYGSRGLSFRSAVYNSDSTSSSNFPQSSSSMTTLGSSPGNFINLKINY